MRAVNAVVTFGMEDGLTNVMKDHPERYQSFRDYKSTGDYLPHSRHRLVYSITTALNIYVCK